IAAAAMMQAIVASGGSAHERIITAEMHSGQQQGFVQGPVDNLYLNALFAGYFRGLGGTWDVAAADVGGMKRARNLGQRLGANVLLAEKQKAGAEKVGVTVYGELASRRVIVPDDLSDTGKTLCMVAKALREKGAEEVYACATHALFTVKEGVRAEQRLQEAGVKVVVTDTVPMSREYQGANAGWLTVLSVAPLFAEAVYLREIGGSLSALFDGG
ncbi:MAG TPA: ribose-phosphate diphosphokinase, partial [archaeon]|nr:ribose-phosphate diphosphokinase [archaeon]